MSGLGRAEEKDLGWVGFGFWRLVFDLPDDYDVRRHFVLFLLFVIQVVFYRGGRRVPKE